MCYLDSFLCKSFIRQLSDDLEASNRFWSYSPDNLASFFFFFNNKEDFLKYMAPLTVVLKLFLVRNNLRYILVHTLAALASL